MRAADSSSAGFQSDMHLIVEQCVAQVREAAGLASFDAEVVLPRTLPLSKKPPPLPRKPPPPLESSNALLGVANTIAWDDLAAALPAQTPRALAATVGGAAQAADRTAPVAGLGLRVRCGYGGERRVRREPSRATARGA